MIYGYARVSTDEQNLSLQVQAITGAGCEKTSIFTDVCSGDSALSTRIAWAQLYKRFSQDDTLIVWRLDRLTRNLKSLLELTEWCDTYGINLVSLTERIDTRNAAGRLVLHVFGAFAQYERAQTLERVVAGIKAARAEGRTFGRPAALDPRQVSVVRQSYDGGASFRTLAASFNVSRMTIRAAALGLPPYPPRLPIEAPASIEAPAPASIEARA